MTLRAATINHGDVIGSEYYGKKAGSFGDTGVFNFHGSKILTTGEYV